jgi:hypothetical protein
LIGLDARATPWLVQRRTLLFALALVVCATSCKDSDESGAAAADGGGAGSGSSGPMCMLVRDASLMGVPVALSYYFRCLRQALATAPFDYCLAVQPSYDAVRQSLTFQLMRGQGFFRITALIDEVMDGGPEYPIRLELTGDTPLLDNRAGFDAAHTRCGTDASLVAAGEKDFDL